jgi:hypothetical protein
MSKHKASFEITAYDSKGVRRPYGGDKFAVCVRGASYVYAKVADNNDGSYSVEYKPSTSGAYSIAITLAGRSMPGSPFSLTVLVPRADASKCTLNGDALKKIIARASSTFTVEFCDAFSQITNAEELDVYVEPRPEPKVVDDTKMAAVLVWAVVVAPKPLYVRETQDLESKRIGEVAPGTLVGVVETLDAGDGSRRARIIFNRGSGRTGGAAGDTSETPSAAPNGTPAVTPRTPGTTPRIQPDTHLARSISPGRSHPLAAPARGSSPRRGGSPRRSQSPRSAGVPKLSSPFGRTAANRMGADVPTGAMTDRTQSAPLANSFMPGALTAREQGEVGWVTAAKDGKETLALRHVKLDASRRQEQMQRWSKQMTAEANRKAAEARALTGSYEQQRAARAGPSCTHELASDVTGIAFAYGGVDPGTLHAHGRLIKTHTVSYSVGKAGQYLLYVGLRNQRMALPGSPFELSVEPGIAHPIATKLDRALLPLNGVVGDIGSVRFVTCDRMGNRCIEGGAPVNVDAKTDMLKTSYVDNKDGTYNIQWIGEVSGTYAIHITIDGLHVTGSPTELKLLPAKPEVRMCEVSGGGLKAAVAGTPVIVNVRCKDRFSNPTLPGSSLSFGLAIALPAAAPEKDEKSKKSKEKEDKKSKEENTGADGEKAKKGDKSTESSNCEKSGEAFHGESMYFEGNWRAEGEYDIKYIAEKAGDFELHLWCDTDGDGKREKLPGSPFMLHVVAAKPSASGSRIIGADLVLDPPSGSTMGTALTAGNRLELGIQLRDPYSNPCAAPERTRGGTHAVTEGKNEVDEEAASSPTRRGSTSPPRRGSSGRLKSGELGGKDKGGASTTEGTSYEEGVTAKLVCQPASGPYEELSLTDKLKPGDQIGTFTLGYELHVAGQYKAHLMLNGQEINGSPVRFTVKADKPSGRLSTLQVPDKQPTMHEEYELLLIAEDKFSNKLDRGGANVQARALGPSVTNAATSTDYNNGTYGIKFTAGAVGEYRVEVRLDNVKIKGSPHVILFTGKKGDEGVKTTAAAASDADMHDLSDP